MADVKRSHADDEDEEYASMGARLRQAREYLGFSQEAVAEALSVPRASISAMEGGHRKVSSLELRDLARLYRRPIGWFYESDAKPIAEDETVSALFRATKNLTQQDKEQLLRFAEFLKGAGQAPPRRRNR